MQDSLSYVIVTPYTVAKSRTGGVLARLLSQLDLELVGAQMFAPDETFAKEYAATLRVQNAMSNTVTLLADYVESRFIPSGGRRHRTLLFLFKGQNPCEKLTKICGHIFPEHIGNESLTGETIRDTYADLIIDPNDPDKVSYFEPAVMTPRDQAWADSDLALFANYLDGKENIVHNIQYTDPSKMERTLVIIKPDNWQYASSRPGNIIDMFSRTGLRIIGVKVHRFTLEQALDFYGPVEATLKGKLAPIVGKKAKAVLEKEFSLTLSERTEKVLIEVFGVEYAYDQFAQIVRFMSGMKPGDSVSEGKPVKSMILIYEGIDAVRKIRDVLGPTDPLKAPGGTVRREFGSNVMVNTAHASDSLESVARESAIVNVNENTLKAIIDEYLGRRFSAS
ncbi:MAG: nucleoside-diphosphate kinase [Treponema sp.]|jgi:nucleoside diphosphate kinase|nr:nucleoside-diphosphate kinase [Treponema sp.]